MENNEYENQVVEQPKTTVNTNKILVGVLVVVLPIMGFFVGLQYKNSENQKSVSQAVNTERRDTIETNTQTEILEKIEPKTDTIVETPVPAIATTINFPVIAFEREGLLIESERAILTKKFIEPYVDYHQMSDDNNLLTTVIEVPVDAGESYLIHNVTSDGNAGGFLFGKRGSNYNYWTPGCFLECEFTDEYSKKYPEVIEQYRKNSAP